MKNKIINAGLGVMLFVALLGLLLSVSVHEHYELESATIRKVVPDARGFIGADEMTLIRFKDGYDTETAGNRGEPGDVIMAYRQYGMDSLIGHFGEKPPRR